MIASQVYFGEIISVGSGGSLRYKKTLVRRISNPKGYTTGNSLVEFSRKYGDPIPKTTPSLGANSSLLTTTVSQIITAQLLVFFRKTSDSALFP